MSAPLILCAGNPDRGDDAAGPRVAGLLSSRGIPTRTLPGDAAGLLDAWTGAGHVILVDAVVTGGVPGTVYRWDGLAVKLERAAFACSTHGFGPAEAVELGRILGRLPARLTVYAIEAAQFELGAGLSPAVETAAVEAAREIADEWRRATADECASP